MRESTKLRVKLFLLGLALLLGGGLLLTPCVFELGTGRFSCYIYGFIHIGSNIPMIPSLPLGFFGIGTYLILVLFGIVAIYGAFKAPKHEARYCPICSTETQQFAAGHRYKDGFKVHTTSGKVFTSHKFATQDEMATNLEGYYYVCEKCKKKNFVEKYCHNCGAKMAIADLICQKCGTKFKVK